MAGRVEELEKRVKELIAEGQKVQNARDTAIQEAKVLAIERDNLTSQLKNTAEKKMQVEGVARTLESERNTAMVQREEARLIASGTGRATFKMERPPLFDGSKHAELLTWLFQLERYMEVAKVPEDQWVNYAASLLRGSAALWYRDMSLGGTTFSSFKRFGKALKGQFGDVNSAARARDKLFDLKQKGSVCEYLSIFRELSLQCDDLGVKEKEHLFLRGLKPNIRRLVELQETDGFADMSSKAETVDRIEWSAHRRENRSYGGTSRGQSYGSQKGYGNQYGRSNYAGNSRGGQGSNPTHGKAPMTRGEPMEIDALDRRDNRRCYSCGKLGHLFSSCWSSGKSAGNRSGQWKGHPQGSGRSQGRNTCYKCEKEGHWARDCVNALDTKPAGNV